MKRNILMLGGLLLIAAALCLTAHNLIESKQAGDAAKKTLLEVNALISELEKVSSEDLLDPEKEIPTVEVNGSEYIGILEMPALDLSLPVMSDWSYEKLKQAPCLYKGSPYQQNMIIAGHNYNQHFGKLKTLSSGDEIFFTDADGLRFCYTVSEIETLNGFASEEMEAGNWALTLFTCTIGGRNRVTVRCSQTDTK